MHRSRLSALASEPVVHNPAVTKRVFVRRGVVPRLMQFAQARFGPGDEAGAHAHADMAEVFLVEAGRGEMTVDGRAIPLEPGDCVVVEPGEVHAVVNVGSEELVLTYFGIAV
jgi:mannose-6-phosphate isomerase-like protein (cupin superfamily)